MYDIFLRTTSDGFLIDRLKFGAGPAGIPTPVLERGAAVRVSRFMLPSLNQIFTTEIQLEISSSVDLFLGSMYCMSSIK